MSNLTLLFEMLTCLASFVKCHVTCIKYHAKQLFSQMLPRFTVSRLEPVRQLFGTIPSLSAYNVKTPWKLPSSIFVMKRIYSKY